MEKKQGDKIIDYYNNLAPTYDENRFDNTYGHFIDSEERHVLNRLLTGKENKVLEIACGTGRLLDYAGYGIDASEKMLTIARQKFPKTDLQQSLGQSTPFNDAYFDAVYSFHLMMHLEQEDIYGIIKESHRILKPKGRLIFDIPSLSRRKLFGREHGNGWHGITALNQTDVARLSDGLFKIVSVTGIMFIPVHRLPSSWRKRMLSLDISMASSPLKTLSSYLIFELEKI